MNKKQLRSFVQKIASSKGILTKSELSKVLLHEVNTERVPFCGPVIDLFLCKFGDSRCVTIDQFMDIWTYLEPHFKIFHRHAQNGHLSSVVYRRLICNTFQVEFDELFFKELEQYYGNWSFDKFVHANHHLKLLSLTVNLQAIRNPWTMFSRLVEIKPSAPFLDEPPSYEESVN